MTKSTMNDSPNTLLALGIFKIIDDFIDTKPHQPKKASLKKRMVYINFILKAISPHSVTEKFGLSNEEYLDVITALQQLIKEQLAYNEENFLHNLTRALTEY